MTRPAAARAALAFSLVPAVLPLVLAAAITPARAVTTQAFVREGDTLRAGTFEGMVATPDGRLVPGPRAEVVARPESAVIWSLVLAGGEVVAGAGEEKGLLRIVPAKPGAAGEAAAATKPGATGEAAAAAPTKPAPQIGGQDVFALAASPKDKDVVFAATGPEGAVYRVDLGRGEAREIYRPQATYVWALLPLADGGLVVATGLPGRVVRVDGRGGGTPVPLWETKESHVRALALGGNGRVLAGTSGGGLLVELDGKGQAYTLWDSDRPEVAAIAVDAAGTVWAAFAGSGRGGASAAESKASARSAGTVSVTVRARPPAGGGGGGGGDEDADATARATAADDKAPVVRGGADLPGGGGALIRIGAGEEPETSWSDERETPLALLPRPGGGVLLGTANPAKIWWLDPAGRLGQFDERKDAKAVSALAAAGDRIVAATSNPATIVAYGPGAAAPARWISDVFDAKVRATIGRVQAVTDGASAADFDLFVRAGNTSEPDEGWTDWVPVQGAIGAPDAAGAAAALPRARFAQVKIESRAAQPYGTGIGRLALRYRPTNRPPRIDDVDALPQGVAMRAIPPSQMSSGEVPVVPPPRGPELERALGEASASWRSKRAYEPNALTITWDARDPDSDALRAALAYCRDRGAPCADGDWIEVADDLDQAFYSFDGRTLPDGIYRFRVTVTDVSANAAGEARTAERVSDPVAIDNAAPVIERAEYTAEKGEALALTVVARDPGGRLVRAEVTREAGGFTTLLAADGVDDGAEETWRGTVPAPGAGEELLVRVTDAAGNSSTRRATAAAGPGSGSSSGSGSGTRRR